MNCRINQVSICQTGMMSIVDMIGVADSGKSRLRWRRLLEDERETRATRANVVSAMLSSSHGTQCLGPRHRVVSEASVPHVRRVQEQRTNLWADAARLGMTSVSFHSVLKYFGCRRHVEKRTSR